MTAMALAPSVASFDRTTLRPVETVVKNGAFDIASVRETNPALAAFWDELVADELRARRRRERVLRVTIENTAKTVQGRDNYVAWTLSVDPQVVDGGEATSTTGAVRSVTFDLHPTFSPASATVEAAPFEIRRYGWGTFTVGVTVLLTNGTTHRFEHALEFTREGTRAVHQIPLGDEDGAGDDDGASAGAVHPSAPSAGAPRMTGVAPALMHGFCGDESWAAPLLVRACDREARPGYNTVRADEFNEDPAVLRAKVRQLAAMIRAAKACVAYTGAGISTASGIGDYASQAKDSAALRSRPKLRSNLDAQPTLSHCVLAALHREGHLHHWCQQNHDGLPQKAGFPQHRLNEVHGAWQDPSNPVVPMNGTLRSDLCDWLREWERKADLCLCLGTSLCGMNADRIVETPATKARRRTEQAVTRHGRGARDELGAVIVGLQRTARDDLASLRIFASIDEVMALLCWEMQLPGVGAPGASVPPRIPPDAVVSEDVFRVPYDARGDKVADGAAGVPWDLRAGARVIVTDGPGKGFEGVVQGKGHDGHYRVRLPMIREGHPQHGHGFVDYQLGSWWVEAATKGLATKLPCVTRYDPLGLVTRPGADELPV